MENTGWKLLSYKDFDALLAARQQLHQAIQQVAAVGRKFLPETKDDRSANLVWVPQHQRLAGNWVQGNIIFRTSLELPGFAILLVDDEMNTLGRFELKGKTQAQSMVWLEEQLVKLELPTANFTLNLPFKIPVYPTAHGKAFELKDQQAFEELANYFHNADHILRPLKREFPLSTDVRCWPHHFDMATQIILNDTGDSETSNSIGAGFSPGDEFYDRPYFYLAPWPYPSRADLKPLNFGTWHEKDWLGAVFPADELLLFDDPIEQQKTVFSFFKEGLDQLVRLLKPNL